MIRDKDWKFIDALMKRLKIEELETLKRYADTYIEEKSKKRR